MRLRLARLHAELSMCMYSLQGLDALMRAVFDAVCQSLIVVSNCRPGSAHSQAARAIWRHRSRARTVEITAPSVRAVSAPVAVLEHRAHEVVRDADRVVGVLVLDRVDVLAVEVHVEARVAQDARLALLVRLAPDELLDVGVVDVEDDHLRGAPRLAARLDRARRRVGAPHEADRARRGAAAREQLLARADLREVDARARAALEDGALLGVPVEDRVHRVVHREDEARARLLGDALHADVEPHRRVERRLLVDDEVLELRAERRRLLVVDEVAVLHAPLADRVDDPVGDLAQRRLALLGAERAAEVLLGEDVRRVDAPGRGHLDAELLEGDRVVAVVGDARVAPLPHDLVVRMHVARGEVPPQPDADPLWSDSHARLLSVWFPTPGCSSRAPATVRVPRPGSVVPDLRHKMLWLPPTPAARCSGNYSTVTTGLSMVLFPLQPPDSGLEAPSAPPAPPPRVPRDPCRSRPAAQGGGTSSRTRPAAWPHPRGRAGRARSGQPAAATVG